MYTIWFIFGHRLDLEVSINPKTPAPDLDSAPPETVPVSPLPAEPVSLVPQVTPCPSGVISGASSDRPRGAVEEARAALLASTKEREELRAELGRLEAQNRRLAERVDQAEAAMVAAREAFAALAAARFFQDATYLDLRPVLGRASAAVGIGEPEQTASWPEALDTATQALTDAEARRDALAERDADAMRPEPVAVTGSDPRWSAILAVVGTLPEVHRDAVGDAICEAYSYGVARGVERCRPPEQDTPATCKCPATGAHLPGCQATHGHPCCDVLAEIAAERGRQDAKWGEQNHPGLTGPTLVQAAAVTVAWIEAIDRREASADA